MERIYCKTCGTKILCNGCLNPVTCPMLQGCILNPKAYNFLKKFHPSNAPFVDTDSGKIYCSCFRCAKNHRSNSQMFSIHCWEKLRDQLDIANPSER